MYYADIHCHMLYGVDDGAKDRREMLEMLERSYDDNVRVLCVTPHFAPGHFGNNAQKASEVFAELKEYAGSKHPDMQLFMGNELFYRKGAASWIDDGNCKTLGNSFNVLVDFRDDASAELISEGLHRLLTAGYRPVLAHLERYSGIFKGGLGLIRSFKVDGVLLQADSGSFLGEFGFQFRSRANRLVKAGLLDVISSDAHHAGSRRTNLKECCRLITKKYGEEVSSRLFWGNAVRILGINSEE